MSGRAKRPAGSEPRRDPAKKRNGRQAGASSQETIDEAAEDAQAEAEMLNDPEQSAGDVESPAAAGAGSGATKQVQVPEALLQRRLLKAAKEKGELEAKVAELEGKLKDAESAAQPAPSPKVMLTKCFSKFNLQEFDTKIGWGQTPKSSGVNSTKSKSPAPLHCNFADYVKQSLIRRLAPATFEIIARSGVRWHNATNKATVAAVLRSYIIRNDIDGLAAHYDSLRARSAVGEKKMVDNFLRSGMHAARQHRELIAKFVNLLFSPTPDQPALNYVKQSVFGVDEGQPILFARTSSDGRPARPAER